MKAFLLTYCFLLFASLNTYSQTNLIVSGLQFTEGPAIAPNGDLFFTDVKKQRIYTLEEGKLSVFLEETGGANGLYFDKDGNLIACAGKARRLISVSPDKKMTTLADSYQGKKLNITHITIGFQFIPGMGVKMNICYLSKKYLG